MSLFYPAFLSPDIGFLIHLSIQYSCLENPMDKRRLIGYGPWGHKASDST